MIPIEHHIAELKAKIARWQGWLDDDTFECHRTGHARVIEAVLLSSRSELAALLAGPLL